LTLTNVLGVVLIVGLNLATHLLWWSSYRAACRREAGWRELARVAAEARAELFQLDRELAAAVGLRNTDPNDATPVDPEWS